MKKIIGVILIILSTFVCFGAGLNTGYFMRVRQETALNGMALQTTETRESVYTRYMLRDCVIKLNFIQKNGK